MNYEQEIQELENKLKQEFHFFKNEGDTTFLRSIEQLLTLAKKMQGEMTSFQLMSRTQDWIPCSERLPEKHGWYLVCFQNSEHRAVDHWTGGAFGYPEMIAWMPLLEPYKGDV